MIDKDGKVVRSVFKEMRLDEISAVDNPAQIGARATIMKRAHKTKEDVMPEDDEANPDKKKKKTKKRAALTTEVDGHSHHIVDADHASDLFVGDTSWNDEHTHPWVRTASDEIVLGVSRGHTHEIALMSKAAAGIPDPAEASNSTSGTTADFVGTVHKEASMSDKNDKTAEQEAAVTKQLEDLTKRADRAEKVSELNDVQRGIFKSMDEAGQDSFLELTPEQRDAEVAKAADKNAVVYTDAEGVEYRKSDDQRLVSLAKRADADRELRVVAEQRNQEADLRKRAEELKHLPGGVEVRMSILKGIDALPEAEQAPALEALKARDAGLAEAFKRAGTAAVPTTDDPLQAIAKRISTEDPSLTPEQAMSKALTTPEGEAIYAKSIGL